MNTVELLDPQSALQRSASAHVFGEQQAAARAQPYPSLEGRRRWLGALERMLLDGQDAIVASINADFGHRPRTETRALELFPSLTGIRHAIRELPRWMHPDRRRVSKWFWPGKAEVRYQPLGVVGIIVPWNYPLYLSIGPLTSALAAGNRAMIKISEFTPAFGSTFTNLIASHFPRDLVHVVTGDIEAAREFSRLPFDHLLFTGSTAVGREIMASAAANLTPVTLELGGKSPAIIAPGFDLHVAARRIAFGKLINAGQTCLAPDYVLAPAEQIETLLEYLRAAAQQMYRNTASDDYSSIAHDRHFARSEALVEDARRLGARIEPLIDVGHTTLPRRIQPAAIIGPTAQMRVMREEIFGPLLPIVPYRSVDEAIQFVNEHARPLALYVFDDDAARRENLLARTASGGVTINDTILHVGQDDLPFGGIGASGMGRYHGLEGFRTFSLARSVFTRSRLSGVQLLYPPYGGKFPERLLKLMLRD